jgi:hypothetical protein
MKIIIKNIINENIDPEEKYVNGLSNIINVPYFYNLKVTDTPEHLWNRILSKVFNQEVRLSNNDIYDSNNNRIYSEDSDGYWEKREFDSNNNIIYHENSDGFWSKREYDSNNNRIYVENSDGYWVKQEYDSNNNEIYYEDSDGLIIDKRNINENIDPEEKYVNGIVKFINTPYFYNLKVTDTPEHLWNRILSKKFNQEVRVNNDRIYDSNNNRIYREDSDGYWEKQEFDSNNNLIYFEDSDGFWYKREYDLNNNVIYFENSKGDIIDKRNINENVDPEEKYVNGLSNIINIPYFYNLRVTDTPEHLWNRILSKVFNQEVRVSNNYIYDLNNNKIYYEDSDGYWIKQEFDSNNNEIYYENSYGFWIKREYDSNNNIIYYEDSDGEWYKQEYDLNNNRIYFENSNGKIIDKRNINENVDPEEKYVNGLSSILKPPYFYNLSVTDTPEHLWDRILSKIFNQEVTVNNDRIYDSNNNQIYRENSDGDWEKYEYDSNNNLIYFEDSDGYWYKREYDLNNWYKREYDLNNNVIYFEDSDGFWYKQEYDSNNNRIYYENSNGRIIDKRSNNPINENIDPEEKYVNGLSNIINVPYFYNLRVTDTPEHLWDKILSKVFNREVRVNNDRVYDLKNNLIYVENSDGFWSKSEYDSNNNEIYFENSDGYWFKQEYDSNNNLIYYEISEGNIIDKRNINENIDPEEKYVNGLSTIINPPYFYNLKVMDTPEHLWNRILSKVFNQEVRVSNNRIYDSNSNEIYYENSNGYWFKKEFDSNNNEIYVELPDGFWEKKEYDSNNNRIYVEDSDGFWGRYEYDLNNNEIYYENSNGSWYKQEYDSNNNRIYYEDSDGKIVDKRNINENIDPEEKYVNGIIKFINIPYLYNLRVTDTPERLWDKILSKKFNQEVRVGNNEIYDSNNNRIYREDSDGYWLKREYDSNNNLIYYEDSDGHWNKREYDSNNNLYLL